MIQQLYTQEVKLTKFSNAFPIPRDSSKTSPSFKRIFRKLLSLTIRNIRFLWIKVIMFYIYRQCADFQPEWWSLSLSGLTFINCRVLVTRCQRNHWWYERKFLKTENNIQLLYFILILICENIWHKINYFNIWYKKYKFYLRQNKNAKIMDIQIQGERPNIFRRQCNRGAPNQQLPNRAKTKKHRSFPLP